MPKMFSEICLSTFIVFGFLWLLMKLRKARKELREILREIQVEKEKIICVVLDEDTVLEINTNKPKWG